MWISQQIGVERSFFEAFYACISRSNFFGASNLAVKFDLQFVPLGEDVRCALTVRILFRFWQAKKR
jgi:hypothetical protein